LFGEVAADEQDDELEVSSCFLTARVLLILCLYSFSDAVDGSSSLLSDADMRKATEKFADFFAVVIVLAAVAAAVVSSAALVCCSIIISYKSDFFIHV
jgi:hypothetical protein